MEPTPTLHPVAAVLAQRTAAGSRPGERADAHRVALAVEGGGMRGVVSAGMTAALERLGLTDAFDLVVGSSAGAINGAALVGGVARAGALTYHEVIASRAFVNPFNVLRRRPVIDVAQILAITNDDLVDTRHERVLESPIELHCVATGVESATSTTFAGMRTRDELFLALLASSRMPWAGGAPVVIDGRRYVDGGMAAAIPVDEAIAAGATHVLALQTRPFGVPRSSVSPIADRLIERHLRGLNPALVDVYRRRVPGYEATVDEIAQLSAHPHADPSRAQVLGIRPAAGTPTVGQLERRGPVLAAAALAAERLVEDALRPLGAPAAR